MQEFGNAPLESNRSKSSVAWPSASISCGARQLLADAVGYQLRGKTQTSMGQTLVDKYRDMVVSENMEEPMFSNRAGVPTSKSQVGHRPPLQRPNPMFNTLNPNNEEDSKLLLSFYKKSYNQVDLSQVNQVHAAANPRLNFQKQPSSRAWDDSQLRMINKDVLRQFGQGNLTDLQRKYQEKLEME